MNVKNKNENVIILGIDDQIYDDENDVKVREESIEEGYCCHICGCVEEQMFIDRTYTHIFCIEHASGDCYALGN